MSESEPTMIGCPACAGVVRAEYGPRDHLQFACVVGHAFSLGELYEAKEEELERAQWSVMALLKHLQMIAGVRLDGPDRPDIPPREEYRRRLDQIAEHIAAIERMIEETTWPARDVSGAGKAAGQDVQLP